jgi:small subunit ribosomal protein S17
MADETTPQGTERKGTGRKSRVGRVISNKMNKTVIVAVERPVAHHLYGKHVTRTKKYYAHDEQNAAREGDTVRIAETRPLSKLKRWRIVEILEQAK